jgi:hypothetical protein
MWCCEAQSAGRVDQKQIPVSVPAELRDVADRLDRLAGRYAAIANALGEPDPELHDDARLFRQVAARARSGADELEQLIERMDAEDAALTSGGEKDLGAHSTPD